MRRGAIVAVDQGTTSTRALVLEGEGPRVVHALAHVQHYPRPGWVEHDPEELIGNIRACLAACAPIAAVGLSNQGESCLAWDARTKAPLSPVIVWQDRRTAERLDQLGAEGAEALVLARAGLPLAPYFSAAKLAWIVENLPDARAAQLAGRLRLGTTDAWFLDVLCDRFVTDATTASRTSLMALEGGDWDDDLCRLFGVPRECLPEILPSTGEIGELSAAFGHAPVRAALVDQQAALYGAGCRMPGDLKITFGTGAFALMVTGDVPLRRAGAGLVPTVAWRRQREAPVYAVDGGVFTASAAVDWARRLGLFRDFAEIGDFPGGPAIESGLVFVPALAGLGAPHWDAQARGAWLGLSLADGAPRLMQALIEGVALRAAEVVQAMQEGADGAVPVRVDGGMSRNPYLVQFLADVLNREIRVAESGEMTGAGVLALTAEACGLSVAPPAARSVQPGADRRALLARFSDAVVLSRRGWS